MDINTTQEVHARLFENWKESISDYAARVGKNVAIEHFKSEINAKAHCIATIVSRQGAEDAVEDREEDLEQVANLAQVIAFYTDAICGIAGSDDHPATEGQGKKTLSTLSMNVGDKVEFRFYNKPERVLYGPTHKGEIIAIRERASDTEKPFQVRYGVEDSKPYDVWLRRKEITRVIK